MSGAIKGYASSAVSGSASPQAPKAGLNGRASELSFAQSLDQFNQPIKDAAGLKLAFSRFNEMSQQLGTSYELLQSQVHSLESELASAKGKSQQESVAKERLADELESLLNLLPAGVVVLSGEGIVRRCNPVAEDMLGSPLEGESWREVVLRSFDPQQSDGHEISLRDGRLVNLATRSLESEPGQLLVLTDLTETRKLQLKVSRHERLSAMGNMVASLAHQIRTPLSSAMLYGGHLEAGGLEPEKQQKFASKLMSRLKHLEKQVRDMLVFAKGELPLSDRISVLAFVQELKSSTETPLEQSQSSLKWALGCEPGAEFLCNKDALVGACQNLINNAIEAVGTQAQITLSLCEHDGDLQIQVLDQGPGFDADTQAKVLEPFFTTKSQGTGLGMAVVDAVARAHKGKFKISSIPGRGTQAVIALPLISG